MFLVRDWSFPYEYQFGGVGGNKLLDARLKVCLTTVTSVTNSIYADLYLPLLASRSRWLYTSASTSNEWQMLEHRCALRKSMIFIFLNINEEFDSIDCAVLRGRPSLKDIPEKFISISQSLYTNSRNRVIFTLVIPPSREMEFVRVSLLLTFCGDNPVLL